MSGMGQNLEVKWQYKSTGIPDNLFSRSKAGLTREEIRSIIASKAEKKVIFTMPAKICDMLEIDAREHFDFEFSSVGQLVEQLKNTDYERLKTFFDTLQESYHRKPMLTFMCSITVGI
jgi:hypothetical protein